MTDVRPIKPPAYDDAERTAIEDDSSLVGYPAPTHAQERALVDGEKAAVPKSQPTSPLDVIRRWRVEGPLVHEPTGLAPLDAITGGGPVYGTRWYVAGSPDAGKTALLTQIANTWATAGIFVGMLAVDEEDGDIMTRIVQRTSPVDIGRARFSRRECEDRPAPALDAIELALVNIDLHLRFFGEGWTIETAAEALARHARANAEAPRMALFADSIQTVSCEAIASMQDPSPRELVTANVRALRSVATQYRLIAMATSEMNRNAYRSIEAAEQSNDLAAAKESGAIEYSARVLLSLRTTKDRADLIQVRAAKNKHGPAYPRGEAELYLRIDRERQIIESADAPSDSDVDDTTAGARAKVRVDADKLLAIIVANPGIGSRKRLLPGGPDRPGGGPMTATCSHVATRVRGHVGVTCLALLWGADTYTSISRWRAWTAGHVRPPERFDAVEPGNTHGQWRCPSDGGVRSGGRCGPRWRADLALCGRKQCVISLGAIHGTLFGSQALGIVGHATGETPVPSTPALARFDFDGAPSLSGFPVDPRTPRGPMALVASSSAAIEPLGRSLHAGAPWRADRVLRRRSGYFARGDAFTGRRATAPEPTSLRVGVRRSLGAP